MVQTNSFPTSCKHFALVLASCVALAGQVRDASADDSVQSVGTAASSIATLHSDFKFSLVVAARISGAASAGAFEEQVRRVSEGLAAACAGLYPEAVSRVGAFDVFIADSSEASARSSASGRIALNAGLAALDPTDDWLALVVAREMAHVVAGHHDNNSTASLITSVLMNLVLPGSGLIKSALSFAGSQVAALAGRERQLGEADEIAIKLLEGAGYTRKALALNLALGPRAAQLGQSAWAEAFNDSSKALLTRLRGGAAVTTAGDAGNQAAPVLASTAAHMHASGPSAAAPQGAPADTVLRTRPSGLSGPLMLDGRLLPFRRVE